MASKLRGHMQILMITNNALEDKTGGHERYVRELSSTLVGRGHAVTIISKRWSADQPARELRPDGVELQRFSVPSKQNPLFAPLFPLYAMRGVAGRVRGRHQAVVHAHMGLQATPLALGRIPFVFTFHAPVWRELLSERQGTYVLPATLQKAAVKSLRAVESYVVRRSHAQVVLSEFMRSELKLLDGSAGKRAKLIPGGVDLDRFSEEGQHGNRDQSVTLFTARRLTPRTGVDELIRAVPLVAKEFPGVQLKIAGTGPQADGLANLVADNDLGRSVQFLGRISDPELVQCYQRASLVVLPTRELEGFGLTTAEAMACGAAVIGTPAGATPELLGPVDPGLIAADVTAEEIAKAIVIMLSDKVRLARARARSREVIAPSMGWDVVADRYLEIYEQLSRQTG